MYFYMLFLCYVDKCLKNFEIFFIILYSVIMFLCLYKYLFNEFVFVNVFVENVEYSNID